MFHSLFWDGFITEIRELSPEDKSLSLVFTESYYIFRQLNFGEINLCQACASTCLFPVSSVDISFIS